MMNRSRHRILTGILILMGMLLLLPSCSLKKNTAASRKYQAFITRYNIHYNGDTHYKETLADMESKYEDDYTRLLFTHPAEARGQEKVPQPQGDFTRSIEKAQKAIQLRSIKKKPARKPGRSSDPAYKAWMKRDEYNPFLHNSWMMMARSQYMNGDFSGAAATFFYISRHFTWLPNTVTEAKIWQARSYCAMGWLFEAETIITRIKPDQLTTKELKSLYYITYSDLLIQSKQYSEAIPYLKDAVKLAKGAQKTRLNFLLGQVATLAGDNALAYTSFGKAAGATNAPYRTKFNARIKQSEVFTGQNIEQEVKSLRRMARFDRNKEYLDQIFYAIGNLYLSRGDTLKAIENYKLAAEKSSRNGIDKAINQVTLGSLYYKRGEYDLAQPCYAEAVPQLPETYPDYRLLKRRSDVLDQLSVYSQNVTLQDSLLKLSYMTSDEQLAVINKIIAELKKKEKEESDAQRREEFMANQPGNALNNEKAPTTFTMNNDGSWYFYNQSTVAAGKTEFQRRWGNRRLEDNWRRRNKASFSFDEFGDKEKQEAEELAEMEDDNNMTNNEEKDEETTKRESDPHFPEYYLKQIPADSAARLTSHDIIQEGLYNMGVILKDKMEDYQAADKEFKRLLNDYPDNIYRLDTYFNLYLMASRQGDDALAEHYRRLILSDFANSPQGQALQDPNYIQNLKLMDQVQEQMFEEAFQAYINNDNNTVHHIYNEMTQRFSMSPIMPKFMFIHALAYVTEREPEKFKEVLNTMLEQYPQTDLAPYASAWLKGLAQGRELQTDGGTNIRGMLWDIKLTTDSVGNNIEDLNFDINADDSQLLVLLYPTDKIAPNQLLYDIARHNFTTFVVKDFDLEQMNFGQLGLLLVRGFDNLNELKHYRDLMQRNPELNIPRGVIPVVISEKNFDMLLKNGASFEQYFEYMRDKTYRDTQESVLDPQIFGPAEPLPPEEPEKPDAEIKPEPDDNTEPGQSQLETTALPSGNKQTPETKTVTTPLDNRPGKEHDPNQKKALPTPKNTPTKPQLPTGSEGDDPLLD